MLRYITSGESHGRGLIAVIEGFPSGIELSSADINEALQRRQKGYGRGGRMGIESDTAEIIGGMRLGKTLGSPLSFIIRNRDHQNWADIMNPELIDDVSGDQSFEARLNSKKITKPRPGHADLPGGIKYRHRDLRNILERASARETAAKTAVGAVAAQFLKYFGIKIISHVTEIGGVKAQLSETATYDEIVEQAEKSQVRCADQYASDQMIEAIDTARLSGDTVGGIVEVIALNIPPGFGSHVDWTRRLDSKLAAAAIGVPAIKAVEFGLGIDSARLPGSEVHDEIFYGTPELRRSEESWRGNQSYYRKTNNAGGIEGGISNGEPIIMRCAMKPIPTLMNSLSTVDIDCKTPEKASTERSDVCAVPAAAVVLEAVVAFEIAAALLEKLGGDSLQECLENYRNYIEYVRGY